MSGDYDEWIDKYTKCSERHHRYIFIDVYARIPIEELCGIVYDYSEPVCLMRGCGKYITRYESIFVGRCYNLHLNIYHLSCNKKYPDNCINCRCGAPFKNISGGPLDNVFRTTKYEII